MTKPIDLVLPRLRGVKPSGTGWEALCPAHDDHNPSLSVSEGDDGRVLLNCWSHGCPYGLIVKKIGLKPSDLWPSSNGSARNGTKRIEYDYKDESGQLLYQSVRYRPAGCERKKLYLRRPDGNGDWINDVKGVQRVLYRLPELIASDPDEPVFITEGEKDANRLAELGFVSTTNACGANAPWLDDFNKCLRGRRVYIFSDNDEKGREHSESVAKSLEGVASHVRIVDPPGVPEKGDISDWLDQGLKRAAEWDYEYCARDEVNKLIVRAGRRPGFQRRSNAVHDKAAPTKPSAFKIVKAGSFKVRPTRSPYVIEGLLRLRETMNVIAEPKRGKTMLVYGLALSAAHGRYWLGHRIDPSRVLLIDNELYENEMQHRLWDIAEAMEVDPDVIDYVSLRGNLTDYDALVKVMDVIAAGQYQLIIVDAHYRMLGNRNENDNGQVKEVYNMIDRYAALTGAAWVLVHHASKGNQSEKGITDVGAGAGSQSRAADTHLVIREHSEKGCCAMDAVTRSSKSPESVVLRYEYPLWSVVTEVDPTQLATPAQKKQKREDDDGRQKILNELSKGEQTANQLAIKVHLGRVGCLRALNALIEEGQIVSEPFTNRGNPTQIYRLAEAPK